MNMLLHITKFHSKNDPGGKSSIGRIFEKLFYYTCLLNTGVNSRGYWSTHTKPSHTRVISHHFWSTHTIYEIKKDYSEGGLWYLAPIVEQSI